jgi:di/tricarboxylate transporter
MKFKWIEKNKRTFAWIYDIWISLLLIFLAFLFIIKKDYFVFLVISFLLLTMITLFFNVYYEHKEKNYTSWGLLIVFVQLIGVPLYYLKKLRPYWIGKKKSVYS